MSATTEQAKPIEASRAKLLKAETTDTHSRLDKSIMAGRPFESRERYAMFLTVQHQFHRDIDALYSNPDLDRILPDLAGRRRFGDVEQDLGDLAVAAPAPATAPAFHGEADIPTALGWLYVAEGSNLGAAFLIKEAAKLGLSEEFGARHLAGAPEGRGLHWKTFTAALDAIELDQDEEARMVEGARAAFRRVQGLVSEVFA
ncbi:MULTISPECIES: biliverdin-producing heme oxygenase [Kaistia]|uniref:Biliverdin-producing heme oxygenase n=1 Tax=Kaistia nematophila TaxID=2994654 RepID=A0A9X3E1W8_9HYPH|nr:biliverdin-producing heme oxygenase [Kaistia nematophila]MCX5570236.1 biliverdin-producing heme oxygenase [Kaistia nematophila]